MVYESLIIQNEKRKTFGRRSRSLPVQSFGKRARNVPDHVMEGNGTELTAWIIENQFHASGCVKNVGSSVRNRNIVRSNNCVHVGLRRFSRGTPFCHSTGFLISQDLGLQCFWGH